MLLPYTYAMTLSLSPSNPGFLTHQTGRGGALFKWSSPTHTRWHYPESPSDPGFPTHETGRGGALFKCSPPTHMTEPLLFDLEYQFEFVSRLGFRVRYRF